MQQEIRFCTAVGGVRIAYATVSSGPSLVKAANYLTHLEHDWNGQSGVTGCAGWPGTTR